MKLNDSKWLLALGMVLLSWRASENQPLQAQEAETLVMVVNKANSAAVGMNLGTARKLVLGEMSDWHNGAKVIVVLTPPGSNERAAVLKKICGMSEAAYTRYEMQAAFTGQTAATVHEAASDAVIKNAVKTNPGAVGFLHKSQVDESVQAVLELD